MLDAFQLFHLRSSIDIITRGYEHSSPSNTSASRGENYSKKRRLDQISCPKSSPQSPLEICAIGSTTHHAEQARAVIQGELNGNERMDRERQSILRSALQFVDVMAQGRGISDKSSPSLDVCGGDLLDESASIAPSPELFYMLLPGTKKTEHHPICRNELTRSKNRPRPLEPDGQVP